MKKEVLLTLAAFLLLVFSACNNSSEQNPELTKELDILSFTVNTPDDWDWQQDQGIDTFIGRITNNTETIFFDMGLLSFGELENVVEDERTLSFQNLTIDGVSAKIVKERTHEGDNSGETRLSAYIDAGDRVHLNRLFVFDPKDEELILDIFKSHKFK